LVDLPAAFLDEREDLSRGVALRAPDGLELGMTLVVWSRDEVVWVDFKDGGVILAGIADGLEGRPPQ
jgi:hypothetical protein